MVVERNMAESVLSVEKFRQQFYDCLKKEDVRAVEDNSRKPIVGFCWRKELTVDPWLHCFYFRDNPPKGLALKFLTRFPTSKDLTYDKIADFISNCPSITDEEMNRCKAKLLKEARLKKLPNLSKQPERLQELFTEQKKNFFENFDTQRTLTKEISKYMANFKISLQNSLEALEPLNEIITTRDITIDGVRANIVKMRKMMEDFNTHSNLAMENITEAFEMLEQYQELDGHMECDLFNFVAHFFPNFLFPRTIYVRGNLRE